MSLRSPFRRLIDLVSNQPLQVGDVSSIEDGIATVTLLGGAGVLQARGATTVGARVYVRAGAIEGAAPTLPFEAIEV
jgi:hypothetical protein